VIIPIVESVMAGALIEQTPHPHEEKASA